MLLACPRPRGAVTRVDWRAYPCSCFTRACPVSGVRNVAFTRTSPEPEPTPSPTVVATHLVADSWREHIAGITARASIDMPSGAEHFPLPVLLTQM